MFEPLVGQGAELRCQPAGGVTLSEPIQGAEQEWVAGTGFPSQPQGRKPALTGGFTWREIEEDPEHPRPGRALRNTVSEGACRLRAGDCNTPRVQAAPGRRGAPGPASPDVTQGDDGETTRVLQRNRLPSDEDGCVSSRHGATGSDRDLCLAARPAGVAILPARRLSDAIFCRCVEQENLFRRDDEPDACRSSDCAATIMPVFAR